MTLHNKVNNNIYARTIAFFLIFLTCLAVYSSSLLGDFIWDDIPQIVENPYIKDISNIPLYFKKSVWSLSRMHQEAAPFYRPVFLLSVAFDYKIWGLNSIGYRVTNLLLHFIIIFFVYLIAGMLLKDRSASLVASAVFALHPANTEVVAWISGRTDMIVGIFLLPAFLLHAKRRYYLSIPLFALALLSKEVSVVFPVIAACYGIINDQKPAKIVKEVTPYVIVLMIYFAIRSIVFKSSISGLVFTFTKFALLAKVIPHYIRFLIFPWPITFLPVDAIPKTLFPDIIGTIVFVGMVAFLFKGNRKVVVFLLIWIILMFLPTLAVLLNPLQNSFGYRFLYLPAVGYAIFIGVLVSNIFSRYGRVWRNIILSIISLFLVSYIFITYISGFNYRTTLALWENSLKYFPDSAFAHNAIASFENNSDKQIYHLKRAIALDPLSGGSYIGLGTRYGMIGNYDLAIKYIEKGIKQANSDVSLSSGYNSLGNIYYLQGKILDAKRMYEKAIEADNLNAEAYYNLALALKATGEPEKAATYTKKYELLISGSK